MNLFDANELAWDLLMEHGLVAKGWTFRFDNAKERFGLCQYRTKQISISRHITAINTEAQVRDTILHEIAHALAGSDAKHGPLWKRMCVLVGANPERCYDSVQVAGPPPNYEGYCPDPNCDNVIERFRLTQKAMRSSCGRHGGYNPKYHIVWKKVQ